MVTKSGLAIELSKLEVFSNPDIRKEQYATDSEIAAQMLWDAFMQKDIEGKTIADLGCGTGILGIGAFLLNAKKVICIDTDSKALEILKKNSPKIETIKSDIRDVDIKADTVIMNPPFGTRVKNIDTVFLKKAFDIADVVYTIHKTSTKKHIIRVAEKSGFDVTHIVDKSFPIKASHTHHIRKIHRIEVSIFRCLRRYH